MESFDIRRSCSGLDSCGCIPTPFGGSRADGGVRLSLAGQDWARQVAAQPTHPCEYLMNPTPFCPDLRVGVLLPR